jgi:hypothetical protein
MRDNGIIHSSQARASLPLHALDMLPYFMISSFHVATHSNQQWRCGPLACEVAVL